jgi:2-methylcitrate dehydratase PrpD
MSRLSDFARWAEEFEIDDVPDDVLEHAKLQVCNALGACYGSLRSDGGELTRRLRESAPEGDATVIGGDRSDAVTAYYHNSVLSMHHDYDDYLFMAHSGHSAVLTSLAVCEENGLGGDDMLRAVVAANELEGRLGASVVIGPHNGQMWSFVHQAGAAAATALLEDVDVEAALSVSLYNPPFPLEPGFMGGDSKSTTATTGCAGIRAARLAASGATGAPDILHAEKGFFERFSYLPFPEALTGFGDSWVTRSLSYKPYPGCAYVQAPVELVDGFGVDPDDVESIEVESSLLTVGMEEMSRSHRTGDHLPPSNVTFSVPYSVALAVHADEYGPEALSESYVRENHDELNRLASKVELRHGWKHTVNAIDGMSRGVALDDLLSERSVLEKISGLRKFREEHSRLSTRRELTRLFGSGSVRDLIGSFSSGVGGDGFDLSDASFGEVEFRFGASVEVHADGTYSAEASDHTGASGRGFDETREAVKEKLRRETPEWVNADDLVGVVKGLEDGDVSELSSVLSS